MKKRIKVKGHYRTVERDEKGRWTSVEKWHSKMRNRNENSKAKEENSV